MLTCDENDTTSDRPKDLKSLSRFFGYCTVTKLVLLTFSAMAVMILGSPITGLHSALMDLDKELLRQSYFWVLALYKLLIIMLNLVPYRVLNKMASAEAPREASAR